MSESGRIVPRGEALLTPDPSFNSELNDLRESLRRKQAELDVLSRRLAALEWAWKSQASPAAPATDPEPAPAPPKIEPPPPTPRYDLLEKFRQSPIEKSSADYQPQGAAPPPAPSAEPKPGKSTPSDFSSPATEAVEIRIGKTWMNRIGAIILLLGVGFFVKYSFDRDWISPLLRVSLAGMTGIALITIGEWSLKRGQRQFAGGLLGAGVAILYLSTFAAYEFYHLISVETAFTILCGVTVLSTVIAIHANLLAIAILALAGGFWTPLALSTGQNRQVILLSYILVLDLGFLLTAAVRRWHILRVLCWTGTAVMFAGWYFRFYDEAAMARTLGFIFAFFLLFHLEAIGSIFRRPDSATLSLSWIIRLNTAAFFASTYFLGEEILSGWLGLICLATALAQLIPCWMLRTREGIEQARNSLLIDGLTLLALAAPIQFDRYLVAVAWSAQSVATFWCCRRMPSPWLRIKAVGILAAAVAHLVLFDSADQAMTAHLWHSDHFHFNKLIALFLLTGVAAYLGSFVLTAMRETTEVDRQISAGLLILGCVLILGVFTFEFDRYAATWMWLALAAIWGAAALRYANCGFIALGLFFVVFAKFVIYDTAGAVIDNASRPLSGIATNRAFVVGLFVVATCLAGVLLSKRLAKVSPDDTAANKLFGSLPFPSFFALLTAIVVTALGTFEIARIFHFEPWRHRFTAPISAKDPFLTGYWCIVSAVIWFIFARADKALAVFAAGLLAICMVKCAGFDTASYAFSGGWRELLGVCTNRVFLSGVLVIAGALAVYRSIRRPLPDTDQRADVQPASLHLLVAIVLLILWLPTFEIMRAFRFEQLRDRFADPKLAMHVALSVFWSLLAIILLIIGFARLVAVMRYLAIGLFGLTIVKVLVVDLSHLEMIYRIISFIVLGVLLLAASYLYQRLSARISGAASVISAPGAQPD
ncbi:hypothetical protein B7486_09730 [cyanobacterium TDX16]|nr:hypothetical protein B7486_09730 [cyanobacterium TDX16]